MAEAGLSPLQRRILEVLVNKLCALLGRSELRDLQDVRALLAAGGDLDRALRDAPRKDGAFSPVTLAWVVRSLPFDALAATAEVGAEEVASLAQFRDELVDRLVQAARPEEEA